MGNSFVFGDADIYGSLFLVASNYQLEQVQRCLKDGATYATLLLQITISTLCGKITKDHTMSTMDACLDQ